METALIDGYLLHLPLRTMKKKAKRIFEIDLLRGLLIIMMVVDHLAYDFGQLAPSFFLVSDAPQALRDLIEWCNNYWYEAWRINFRYAVIALFFILSGLSTYLSRNSIKRGMVVLGFGAIISIFSYFLSITLKTDLFIFFGIILCLGLAMITYSLFRTLIIKMTKSKTFWLWTSLFLAILFTGVGYWMRLEVATVPVDAQNWWFIINGRMTPTINSYRIIQGVFTPIVYGLDVKLDIVLGRLWYGVDWAGLFPYLGYTFFGGFLGELLYAQKKSLIFKRENVVWHPVEKVFRPLTFIGSKTIYIYLLHQVVLAALTALIFILLGIPLK
ncbi:MAG TPA: heparan-alpha-glucosaminide N-acetyltransferase domain-containing protein [Bacilli bacterium]|nr:heparan-alpha-glucosaminide N-acetyltransferase domain-containing protein [Bacilli bacterium]